MDNSNPNSNPDEPRADTLDSSQEPFDDWNLDFDDENERDDLVPILGISALLAAVVGAFLVLLGRLRHPDPTPKERLEELLAQTGKQGKRGGKQIASAVEHAHLGDMLEHALDKAKSAASDFDVEERVGDVRKAAHHATKDMHLSSLLSEAADRVRDAADNLDVEDLSKSGRKRAKDLYRSARHAADDIDVEETTRDIRKFAEGALSGARHAAKDFDVEDTVTDARKRVSGAVSSVRDGDIDTKGLEHMLDTLKDRLGDAIDSVRHDVAPKAADRLKSDVIPAVQDAMVAVATKVREDVLPTAQDAVDKVREDVLPPAQERLGKFADDLPVSKNVRKAASSAMDGAGSFGDMVRAAGMTVAARLLDEVLPAAKKTGGKAVTAAREDFIPAASHTAQDAAQRVREDVLPKVGDIASQAPDVLSDLLKMARERAEEAFDHAQPFAADAFETGRARAGDAATFGIHRASEAATGVRNAGSGVGGAVSSVGQGVTGAVGGAVGATVSLTKETTGLLFWLGLLGGLILLVFVPDREKQSQMWNSVLQLLNELREMWKDFQGDETGTNDPETV